MVCHASSIPIQKGRDRYGIYIQGLGPDLSNLENLAGAPSLTREEAHKSLERRRVMITPSQFLKEAI